LVTIFLKLFIKVKTIELAFKTKLAIVYFNALEILTLIIFHNLHPAK